MTDILQLKYLECCIKEALRLFPSVAMYGRTLSEDATIRTFVSLLKRFIFPLFSLIAVHYSYPSPAYFLFNFE